MKNLATILALLTAEVTFSVDDAAKFIGGLIYGLVQDDDLAEIQKCLTHGSDLEMEIMTAVSDFEKKDLQDIIAGIEEVGKIIQELPTDLQDCKDIQGDLTRIEAWAQIFKNPKQLVATMTANFVKNHKEIIANATAVASDWAAEDYYQSGDDVANVLVLAIGAVPATEAAQPENLEVTMW
mmetsp:Transcript_36051/g.55362  ORF Transcript_36051/g.55362 Transcript_36051/m.55362 type:complete len:181 (-) Transcript_36051:59-601(-)